MEEEMERVTWRDFRVKYASGTPEDLVIRQLIRNITPYLFDMSPTDFADILSDEANKIYHNHPKVSPVEES